MSKRKFPQAHIFYNFFDLVSFLESIDDLNENDVQEFIDAVKALDLAPDSMLFMCPMFGTRHREIMDVILNAGFIKDEYGAIRFRM